MSGRWIERSHGHYVLSVDAVVYEYIEFWTEEQERPYRSTDKEFILKQVTSAELVGTTGKPFSKWRATMERVGW